LATQIALATTNFIMQKECGIFCKWPGREIGRMIAGLSRSASCEAQDDFADLPGGLKWGFVRIAGYPTAIGDQGSSRIGVAASVE
jgi:hypothetical protein